MLPPRVSFHDAVIVGIATGPGSVALSLEGVTAETGHLVSGWVRFDGVTRIARNGETIPELAMAGSDGEIVTLEQLDPGRLSLFVVWAAAAGPDHHSYVIECRRADWLQREEQ